MQASLATMPLQYMTIVSFLVIISSVCSNTTCPTWHYYDNDTRLCQCGLHLNCKEDVVEIRESHCATSAGYRDYYYTGLRLFSHTVNNTNRLFSEMPSDPDMLDDVMCGYSNRKGLLCGECYEGFGPAIYSLDLKCVNCSQLSLGYAILSYILLEITPITVFFVLIVLFRFNFTSGPMLGYVVFCQFLAIYGEGNGYIIYAASHQTSSLQIGLFLCQFWTMHWFFKPLIPSFCISDKLTAIHIVLLRSVSLAYPIILVFLTSFLIELHSRNNRLFSVFRKPISFVLKKCKVEAVLTSDSVVHAFASFIFLTCITTLSTFLIVLSNTTVYRQDGSVYKYTVSFDTTVEWGNSLHILTITSAAIPTFFLTFLPLLLLSIYPTRIYRHLSRYISSRKRLVIMVFAEAPLHSCFKDGLNGTRDYRALAGTFPLIIVPYLCIEMLLQHLGFSSEIAAVFLLLLVIFLLSCLRPCKSALSNASLNFHFILIVILLIVSHAWFNSVSTISTETLANILTFIYFIPHMFVFVCLGHIVMSRYIGTLRQSHFVCFSFHRSTYQQLVDT